MSENPDVNGRANSPEVERYPGDSHDGSVLCPNCGEILTNSFCAACGQKRIHPGDLSLGHAWHHVTHEVLHVDGRIFRSLRTLVASPGQLTLDFWDGRRASHVHPIRLFLIFFFLYFLFAPLSSRLNLGATLSSAISPAIEASLEAPAAAVNKTPQQVLRAARERTSAAFKPFDMLAVVLSGAVMWMLFRKRRRFLAEHMVMALHLACFNMGLTLTVGWLAVAPGVLGGVGGAVLLVGAAGYFLLATRRVYGGSWLVLLMKYVIIEVAKAVMLIAGLLAVFVYTLGNELATP